MHATDHPSVSAGTWGAFVAQVGWAWGVWARGGSHEGVRSGSKVAHFFVFIA